VFSLGSVALLVKHAWAIAEELNRFHGSQGHQLPDGARSCLSGFVEAGRFRYGDPDGLEGMTALITSLISFRADFEYLISDAEAVAKSLSRSRVYSPSEQHCRRRGH
jgi:hypothetical protein